jgi:hypothetical protein
MARATNAKAKEKKQKIILGVAGVLLLGLVAIQGPKFMKLVKGSSPAATATTTASSTTSSTTAVVSTSAHSSLAASSDKLSSLRLFRAKDPFAPLVSDTAAAAPAPASTPAPAPAPTPAPAPAPTPAPVVTLSPATASGPLFGTVAPVSKGSKSKSLPTARIVLNGKPAQIALGKTFPASKPVFRLAGVLPGSISIALANGSLADGSSALKLRNGQSTTLMNTADRHRYTIKLVATKVR